MNPDHLKTSIDLTRGHLLRQEGGPFGCVIVREGEVVGTGVNRVTTLNDPTAHAEILAIRDACAHLDTFTLEGCTLYATCEPCPMCLGAIYWARIDRVVYASNRKDAEGGAFDDARIYSEFALPPEERSVQLIYQPRPEAVQLFSIWNDSEGRTPY